MQDALDKPRQVERCRDGSVIWRDRSGVDSADVSRGDEQWRGWEDLWSILLDEAGRRGAHCHHKVGTASGKESAKIVYERSLIRRLEKSSHFKGGLIEVDRGWRVLYQFLAEPTGNGVPGRKVGPERVQ